MRGTPWLVPALCLLAPLACASTSIERRDYILAHPHGWVEVTVADDQIPQVPKSEDEPGKLVRPRSCTIEVSLDGEPFIYGASYPTGDAPPYAADTGFRFPAPPGAAELVVEYSGCDVESGKAASVRVSGQVAVERDRVSEVRFDGAALTALPVRDDSVVTMEDLYQAITGRPKAAP
jgi:hypothetical protein